MQLWLIPMIYVGAAVLAGLTLPRLEQAYLTAYTLSVSVSSAQAYLSAGALGMMALTGIVFAMAFVVAQFSAIAYSPRLVLWFARDPISFHALGVFGASFVYALFTLAWVDRGGSGAAPLVSSLFVAIMILYSLLLFSRLMRRLSDLQISNVLHSLGDPGRAIIRELFAAISESAPLADDTGGTAIDDRALGPAIQVLRYSGAPRTIATIDAIGPVGLARQANATILMLGAVGDTLVQNTPILRVHGAGPPLRGLPAQRRK